MSVPDESRILSGFWIGSVQLFQFFNSSGGIDARLFFDFFLISSSIISGQSCFRMNIKNLNGLNLAYLCCKLQNAGACRIRTIQFYPAYDYLCFSDVCGGSEVRFGKAITLLSPCGAEQNPPPTLMKDAPSTCQERRPLNSSAVGDNVITFMGATISKQSTLAGKSKI
jgi:hypothetical protein